MSGPPENTAETHAHGDVVDTEKEIEALAAFDVLLSEAPAESPWDGQAFHPNFDLLQDLLAVPISRGDTQESGKPAKALDFWLANEFRRAGFEGVWPRARDPRVLTIELAAVEEALERLEDRVISMEERHDNVIRPSIRTSLFALRRRLTGTSSGVILGRFYPKQIDVLISSWKTGPELLVSTKTMFSSYRKNRPNRFEEAVGDATNLRTRHPMAAIGYAYLVRANIKDEPGAKALIEDMVSKLRSEEGGYDATTLIVAKWEEGAGAVEILEDRVPEQLRADKFFRWLIDAMLTRTPVSYHVKARELRAGGTLDVEEAAEDAEQPSQ